jgi:hypothetical protein
MDVRRSADVPDPTVAARVWGLRAPPRCTIKRKLKPGTDPTCSCVRNGEQVGIPKQEGAGLMRG